MRCVGGTVIDIPSAANPIQGEIGVGIAKIVDSVDGTVVEGEAYPFARTKHVVLGNAGIENNTLHLRVTHTRHQVPRCLLGHCVIDIYLIGGSRNSRRFNIDILKITESFKARF